MFYPNQAYYFATIRKITVAFGSLFTNINIARYSLNGGNGEKLKTIKVPFAYAESEKWLSYIKENITPPQAVTSKDPNDKKTRIYKSLPRMSYQLTDLQYDPSRKLQTTRGITGENPDITKLLSQLNPVPYDIAYTVNVAIKNIDDGLQIIEQILPNFTPSFNVTIQDIPELNIVRDVPIIFGGITKSDTFEGAYEDRRIINWQLSFIAKGYIYPAIKDSNIIRKAIASIYPDEAMQNNKTAEITAEVIPSDANFNDDWTAKITIDEEPDSNG